METPTTSGTSVVAEDFERSTRVELLEKRFEQVEGTIATSKCGRLCGILWKLTQLVNTMVLYVLVGLFFYEFSRIRSLESELQTEQHNVDHLQARIAQVQSSMPNSTQTDIQIEELDQRVQEEQKNINYVLSGTFTLLTCLISMFHMSSHLTKMKQPMIQRKIISILWMSPIYSVTSFLSLLYPPLEGPMKIVKDFYESYCIYQFLSFMIVVLGSGSRDQAVEVLAKHADHLPQPSRYLNRFYDPPPDTSNHSKANAVMMECQISAMQFVFIRPLTSIIYVIFVLDPNSGDESDGAGGMWDNASRALLDNVTSDTLGPTLSPTFLSSDSQFLNDTLAPAVLSSTMSPSISPSLEMFDNNSTMTQDDIIQATKSYFMSLSFVIAMVVNVSVFFAFMGLLKFHHAVHEDLLWIRPWPKFLTIKGVVFLTFWQGLMILILVNLEDTKAGENASLKARQYQNMLICLEMLFFSVTHWCVFPAEEWEKDYRPSEYRNKPGLGIQDFVSDVNHIVKSGRRKSKRRRRRGRRAQGGLYEKPSGSSEGKTDLHLDEEEEQDLDFGRRMYDFDDDFRTRDRTMSNDSNISANSEFDSDDNELI
jgi:hypothetical protein